MKGKKLSYKERVEKIKTNASERRKVFNSLLEHLRGGLSVEAFPLINHRVIREIIKNHPLECPVEELEHAIDEGRAFWEKLGRRQADGSCAGNSRTWFYNMANRYGWSDRQHVENKHDGQVNVNIVSYATSNKLKPMSED